MKIGFCTRIVSCGIICGRSIDSGNEYFVIKVDGREDKTCPECVEAVLSPPIPSYDGGYDRSGKGRTHAAFNSMGML